MSLAVSHLQLIVIPPRRSHLSYQKQHWLNYIFVSTPNRRKCLELVSGPSLDTHRKSAAVSQSNSGLPFKLVCVLLLSKKTQSKQLSWGGGKMLYKSELRAECSFFKEDAVTTHWRPA